MDIIEYTAMAGEKIQEWIEKSLTFENRCKRDWEEGDGFESDEVSWIFTQKGERLYRSYLSKVERLIGRKFPDEYFDLDELEMHAGVMYP